MKKEALVLAVAAALLAIFVMGSVYYKNRQSSRLEFMAQENASTFVREHSRTLGADDAKVYLVEFFDPACETCGAFHPFVKDLMAAHPGKIKLVMRYAPFHQGADHFVKILEAAGKQGKYWETLKIMFETQSAWASHHAPRPEKIWPYLARLGLDLDKIRADMKAPELDGLIQQDLEDARTLGVQKTPGFFVNGKPLQTFGYNQLKDLVESEVKQLYGAR